MPTLRTLPAGRRSGMTLVEILIALLIFAIVAALAGGGIVQSLRLQRVNEAHTEIQGKLRRITEVIAQDLRSSVLGALVTTPYSPNASQVSFTLADGGQGYQVLDTNYSSTQKRIYATAASAAALGVNGRRLLVVNGSGAATVQTVTAVGTPSQNRWVLTHNNCSVSTMPHVHPVRAFVVESVGYAFNSATGTLSRATVGGAAVPVAFDLSGFRIEYAYRGSDGSLRLEAAPFFASGRPLRVHEISGVTYTLESLQVTVSAQEPSGSGSNAVREYVSQIAMPATGSVSLRSVVSCT